MVPAYQPVRAGPSVDAPRRILRKSPRRYFHGLCAPHHISRDLRHEQGGRRSFCSRLTRTSAFPSNRARLSGPGFFQSSSWQRVPWRRRTDATRARIRAPHWHQRNAIVFDCMSHVGRAACQADSGLSGDAALPALRSPAFRRPIRKPLHSHMVLPKQRKKLAGRHLPSLRSQVGFKAPNQVGTLPRPQPVRASRNPVVAQRIQHICGETMREKPKATSSSFTSSSFTSSSSTTSSENMFSANILPQLGGA